MDNRFIGVFDSGLGGLTCVKQIMSELPNEGIVYFGDTGRVPYGTRSNDTIVKYVEGDINFLNTFDTKIIVIACGTASAVALEKVQGKYSNTIIGVVIPAAKKAVQSSVSKRIGVLGTVGAINSGKYTSLLKQLDSDIIVTSKACPLFVPLVENGYLDSKITYLTAEEYLQPLKEANVDTIILGCTHYPLISKVIRDIMGSEVTLIDPGLETAKYVKWLLQAENLEVGQTLEDKYKFFVSDSAEDFARLGGMFLEKPIGNMVKKINIEKY